MLLSLLLTLSPNPEVAPATVEADPDPEMAAFLPVRQQVDSCLRAGEYQAAWDLLQEAASRFQEAGWLRPLSACRHRQGVVAERMGKDNMAANYFREALQLVRETGNLPLEKLLVELVLRPELKERVLVVLEELGVPEPGRGPLPQMLPPVEV